MADIADFRAKWEFYKPRAHLISPHFAAFGEDTRITQDMVAGLIPKSVSDPIPAGDAATIAGAAFGQWLASGTVPDNTRPGDPVRRGFSAQAPASLEYWITRLRG